MAIVIDRVTYDYTAPKGGKKRGSSADTALLRASAVTEVSLTIGEGEFFGVIGHTGSGKSTLMQLLNGLLVPTDGSVSVDGFDTRDKQQRKEARARVGLVFQYPEYQLFEETVERDIAFGPKNLGLSEAEASERVKEAMALVGLDYEKFAQKSPFDLSGGEKRRTALAGILAMRPKYLALDEPMAGLDPRGRREVLSMLETLRERTGCTVIMVSHSMDDVARHADRIAVMDHGRLAMLGKTGEVFARADELKNMGLSVPQATKLAHLLRQKGIDAPMDAVTAEAITAWLLENGGAR